MDSEGYDHLYARYLEHYLGGRDWRDELDKAYTSNGEGGSYDARGPAPIRSPYRRANEYGT